MPTASASSETPWRRGTVIARPVAIGSQAFVSRKLKCPAQIRATIALPSAYARPASSCPSQAAPSRPAHQAAPRPASRTCSPTSQFIATIGGSGVSSQCGG